jgi:hypothetical protein
MFAVIFGISILGLLSGCAVFESPRDSKKCEDPKGEYPVHKLRPIGGIGGFVGNPDSFKGFWGKLNAEPRLRIFWGRGDEEIATTVPYHKLRIKKVPEGTPATIEWVLDDDKRKDVSCNFNRVLTDENFRSNRLRVAILRIPKSRLEEEVYDP